MKLWGRGQNLHAFVEQFLLNNFVTIFSKNIFFCDTFKEDSQLDFQSDLKKKMP